MDLYILDNLGRRYEIVDTYESLIWTERWQAWGDFELVLTSNNESRGRFMSGVRLSLSESKRVMEVETVVDAVDDDGKRKLTVKGRSLEKVFEDRVAADVLYVSGTDEPKWTLTGVPALVMRLIYSDICYSGVLSSDDILPGVIRSSLYPENTIPESTESITVALPRMTLYEALGQLANLYDLGYRITRSDAGVYHFDVYSGNDRTSSQDLLAPVIFSPSLDNLNRPTEFISTEQYKNVAYVISKVGSLIVFADGVDPEVAGFERRVLLVKADDITDSATATVRMTQRGKEELAKARVLMALDGELNPRGEYKYGVDYELGDLIEMRNSDGVTNNMRVSEQIFVSDKEGQRSYPTLSIYQFILPGTWLAWDYNQVWAEVDPDLDWADA